MDFDASATLREEALCVPAVMILAYKASTVSATSGVEPEVTPMVKHTDEMVKQADTLLIQSGRAHEGENVVIVAGSPPGIPGSTNAMRVHRVGDAVGGVVPAYR